MKEFCVIFDTNILIENKKDLNDIKKKLNLKADIFIPMIVIGEIEAQKSRNVNEDYLKIKAIVKKNTSIFNYEEKFKLEDVLRESERNIENWLKSYCDYNIINYDDITIIDILNRLKYKMAPFINETGSSDKGFKDSIIWLSILRNNKLKEYKTIILVTNDKTGFIKRKNELYEEYSKTHDNNLVISSSIDELYNKLAINKSENEEISSEKIEEKSFQIENINDLKDKLNSCVNNILYTCYEDDWGNEHCDDNFNIYQKMANEDIECFLTLLEDFLKENIFFNMIDITDLLIRCGIDSAGESVPSKYLNQLNDIYNILKNNQELYNPFLKFLKTEFNKVYKFKQKTEKIDIDDTDLPF